MMEREEILAQLEANIAAVKTYLPYVRATVLQVRNRSRNQGEYPVEAITKGMTQRIARKIDELECDRNFVRDWTGPLFVYEFAMPEKTADNLNEYCRIEQNALLNAQVVLTKHQTFNDAFRACQMRGAPDEWFHDLVLLDNPREDARYFRFFASKQEAMIWKLSQ